MDNNSSSVKPLRELTMADFMEPPREDETGNHQYYHGRRDKSRRYSRHQTDYGEKKYIKPWRTGTKSQQIPTKGSSNNKSNR